MDELTSIREKYSLNVTGDSKSYCGESVSQLELLNYAITNDMIDMELVQKQIEMQKRKELLENHPYSIWEGNDGKWYTYLPDGTKERGKALKKRNSQAEIENVVVSFWREQEKKNKVYRFDDVYWLWREVQDQMVSENSIAKYDSDYNRFFKETEFTKKRIDVIDEDCIRIFMCQTVKRCRLGRETTRKLFAYIRNTILTARKKKIIADNPLEFIVAKDFYKDCTERYKTDEMQTISKKDMKALQEQFKRDHERKPNYIPTYAVEFASLTGMRVSEISALTWDCIKDEYIVVDKSEKSNRTKTEFYIDATKTRRARHFPMTVEIRAFLDRLKAVEQENGYLCEWVFADENGRIHAPKISSCAKTKCRQLGIDEKGIHAYRKTLNSQMRKNGVSATVAASMLGHSKEVNERYYTYDVSEIEYKSAVVSSINKATIAG